MDSTSENQIEKRSFFNGLCYKIVKSFFDSMGVIIGEDIKINDDEAYFRFIKYVICYDRCAAGESFMDGQWETDDLIALSEKVFRSRMVTNQKSIFISKILHNFPQLLFNMQTKVLSKKNVLAHYDIGNDLFEEMLDRTMMYTCAYWDKNVTLNPWMNNNEPNFGKTELCETLEEAQLNKMLLIARKLHLKPGMKGFGWGSLAKFLATNFDVHVVAINISNEQYNYATTTHTKPEELDFLRIPGLKSKGTGTFEFKLQDYRDVEGVFDRITAIGIIEHVGKKNYDEFFNIIRKCLDRNGLFLLHTIGINNEKTPQVDPWALKYIFPNGMIPYHTQLINASHGKMMIEDWHNMGYSYYRTLMVWNENFQRSWPKLKNKYDERFKRMWTYYLLMSAFLFKIRNVNLWQIVFSRGYPGGYVSFR